MNTIFVQKEIKYTGAELSPHWIYRNFNVQGNAILAFIGPVNVSLKEMVDIEDVIAKEGIRSDKMLNFIVEIFEIPLTQMVLVQRLFMAIIKETLEDRGKEIKRFGDDLYFEDKKLSVSIATKALTSCLIHSAINIVSTGAPIEISSLSDMGIDDPKGLALEVMKRFKEELESIKLATTKVRGAN